MTKELFKEIHEWQTKTFPAATSLSKTKHLEQEVVELRCALLGAIGQVEPEKIKDVKLEFADCFLLLFGAAASFGMSYEDIIAAVEEKFSINKTRKWGKPDANGVVKHVPDDRKDIIIIGKQGAGKSTIARKMVDRRRAVWIDAEEMILLRAVEESTEVVIIEGLTKKGLPELKRIMSNKVISIRKPYHSRLIEIKLPQVIVTTVELTREDLTDLPGMEIIEATFNQ